MFLFCLGHNLVYLLYVLVCPSLDISKINKQRCGLARNEYGNAVFVDSPWYVNCQ